jgi:transcriptional regulator with XRE-family HTH domain
VAEIPVQAPTADPARQEPQRPKRQREPLWRDVLGEHLRSLRRDRGETLAETAGRAGVSPQYLSEMERGVKEPSSEMIAAVAGALDVSLVEVATAIAEQLRSLGSTSPTCRAGWALAA